MKLVVEVVQVDEYEVKVVIKDSEGGDVAELRMRAVPDADQPPVLGWLSDAAGVVEWRKLPK